MHDRQQRPCFAW